MDWNAAATEFLANDEAAGVDSKLAAEHHTRRVCAVLGIPFDRGVECRISAFCAAPSMLQACPTLATPFFIRAISHEVEDLVVSCLPAIDDPEAAQKVGPVRRLAAAIAEVGGILTKTRTTLGDLDSWAHAVLSTAFPAIHIACTQFLTLAPFGSTQTPQGQGQGQGQGQPAVAASEFDALKREGSRLLNTYLKDSIGVWVGLGSSNDAFKPDSEPQSLDSCYIPLLSRLASVDALEQDLGATNAVWKYLIRLLIRPSASPSVADLNNTIGTALKLCESARVKYADLDFSDERQSQRRLKVLRFFLGQLVSITRRYPDQMPNERLSELLVDVLGSTPPLPKSFLPSPKSVLQAFLVPAVEAVLVARVGGTDSGSDESRWDFVSLFDPHLNGDSDNGGDGDGDGEDSGEEGEAGDPDFEIESRRTRAKTKAWARVRPRSVNESESIMGRVRCSLAILLCADRCSSQLQAQIASKTVSWILDAVPSLGAVMQIDSVSQVVSPSKDLYATIRDTLCAFSLRLRVALFSRIEIVLFNYTIHDAAVVRYLVGDWWCFIARHSKDFLGKKHAKMLWDLALSCDPSSSAQSVRVRLAEMCGRLLRQMPPIDAIAAINLNDIGVLQREMSAGVLADVLLSLPLGDLCISQMGGPAELRGFISSNLLAVAAGKCLATARDTGSLVGREQFIQSRTETEIGVLSPLRLMLSIVRHRSIFPGHTPPEQRRQACSAGAGLLSRLGGEPTDSDGFAVLASLVLETVRYLLPLFDGGAAIEVADSLRLIYECCPRVEVMCAVADLAGMLGTCSIPQISVSRALQLFRLLFRSLFEHSSTPRSLHAAMEAFRQFASSTSITNLEGFVPPELNAELVSYISLWRGGDGPINRAREVLSGGVCWSALVRKQAESAVASESGGATSQFWDPSVSMVPGVGVGVGDVAEQDAVDPGVGQRQNDIERVRALIGEARGLLTPSSAPAHSRVVEMLDSCILML